jgi:hypothetical protein
MRVAIRGVAMKLASLLAGVACALTPTLALAQDAQQTHPDATHQNAYVLPSLAIDTGMGASAPMLSTTTFHYDGFKVTGAQIGMPRGSTSAVFASTMHFFPFATREIGFIATLELLIMNNDSTYQTPTGSIGGSTAKDDGPSYYSAQFGPEAQMRFGSFIVRAAGVVGWRDVSFQNYDALDWRVGVRAQIDYQFIGGHAHDGGISGGLFANVDALPGFGWSTGASVSYAF